MHLFAWLLGIYVAICLVASVRVGLAIQKAHGIVPGPWQEYQYDPEKDTPE